MKMIAATVLCVDFFPESERVLVGGNSVNFATQCKRSGVAEVSVLGAVGDDSFGETILRHLNTRGIDARRVYVQPGETAGNKIFISPEGERYFKPDSWTGGVYQSFQLSADDWDFVNTFDVLAMPANNPNFEAALTRRAEPCRIIVDFLDEREVERVVSVSDRIDVGVVSGTKEMVAQVAEMSDRLACPLVITLGSEGSLAFDGGRQYRQPAIAVPRVVDTTGCGDAFQAAFAVAWFQGMGMETALEKGAEAAAQILSRIGGV